MDEKKMITLDLTGCRSLGELHKRIKEAFDFPDFYGENWDAFWDLLRTECDADEVKIVGECTLSKDFEPHIKIMHEVLKDFKQNCEKYDDHFDFQVLS